MGWTRDRLEDVARTRLGGAKLIIVANREPYIHQFRDGAVEVMRPAGGLTAALDPVMRACGVLKALPGPAHMGLRVR